MSGVTVEIRGKETVSQAAGSAKQSIGDLNSKTEELNTGMIAGAAAAAAVVAVVRQVAEVVDECVNEYAEQDRAIRVWQASMTQTGAIAAGEVGDLREFAGAIADLTGIDDEAALSMETFLSISGRNAKQIKQLMQAAADMSVAMGDGPEGLRTRVEQLNAMFSGTSGKLEKLVPELKGLSKAQLEAGDGVSIVAEKYKGLASTLQDSVDVSLKNYRNAWNDIKGEFGAGVAESFKPVIDWLTQLMRKWKDAAEAKREYAKVKALEEKGGTLTVSQEVTKSQGDYLGGLHNLQQLLSLKNSGISGADMEGLDRAIAEQRSLNKDLYQIYLQALSAQGKDNAKGGSDAAKLASEEEYAAKVKSNYAKLQKYLEGFEAEERKASYFHETQAASYQRVYQDVFAFSELVRDMDLGPQGQELKEQIQQTLSKALTDSIDATAGDLEDQLAATRMWFDATLGELEDDITSHPVWNLMSNSGAGSSNPGADFLGPDSLSIGDAIAQGFIDKWGDLNGGSEVSTIARGAVEAKDEGMSGLIGGLQGFIEALSMGGSVFADLLSQLPAVTALLNPITTILSAAMDVIGPLLNTVLTPLVGILEILGNTLGMILAPIISALSPIILAIAEGFLALYNYAIRPFANSIIAIGNILYNAVAHVYNWLAWIWGGSMGYRSLGEGTLDMITMEDVTAAGTAATSTTSTTGSSASYSKQRDINVDVDVYTSALVGEDGIRQFALIIGRELQSAGVLGLT